jgi:putative ABC transport system permease protein
VTRLRRPAATSRHGPPRGADWLLRVLLPPGRDSDAIRGDLIEEFRRRRSAGWFYREAFSTIVQGHRYRHMMTLDSLLQDARYAARAAVKAPGFTLLVVLTLALGIGASTAIFSIVNGVLLRPLSLREPDRLLWISEANGRGDVISASWMNYVDWRARAHAFDGMAASRGSSLDLTGIGQARRITGRMVTGNFFQTLGAQPSLGRVFGDADERPGADRVAIVSDEFWRRQLNGDRDVLGRTLTLDGKPHTIVGVLPAGFRYLRSYDVFTALGGITGEPWLADRGNHQGFVAIGRLRPGVTREAAFSELQQIEADLTRSHPDTNADLSVVVEPLAARLVKPIRDTLLVLAGAVGILLLVACVNVAGLLVARGAARQHELAVRAALGGRRGRLVRQLLVESTMLALAGGVLGIAMATVLLRVLIAVAPPGTPRLDEVVLDGSALVFALAAATACGVLFGLLPAAQASRANGQRLVIRTRAAGASAASHRLRRVLMAVEVALALILLTAAGLMMRTLMHMTSIDAGFHPDHTLVVNTSIPEATEDRPRRIATVNEILARTRALPGVTSAGAGMSLPIDGSNWNSVFWPRDKPLPPAHDGLPSAAMLPITDGYFDALGARLVKGRPFDARDTATSAPVAIVNEALAARIWPGQDPIGRQLKQGWPESKGDWREVVGVVADIKFEGITERTTLQFYLPLAQDPPGDFWIVAHTAVVPASISTALSGSIAAVNRDMPIATLKTMDEIVGESIARQRMARFVLGVFAGLAITLAAVGLFGLVAHGVTERRHEVGVRLALGAPRASVIGLLVRHAVGAAMTGAVAGVVVAMPLTRSLEGLLFGVRPVDPATLVGVVLFLLVVTLAACALPAWRASRASITTALRAE